MIPLTQHYDQKLKTGSLRPDDDQKHAIAVLDALCKSLEEKPPRSLWKRGKKQAASSLQRQGCYLHGGVGRGKTMVMDLFFQAAPVRRKRRVHFHAFMLEVHDHLHRLRTTGAAARRIDGDLLACADKIAEEARLLCFDEFQVKDVADAMILGRLFTALFARSVVVVMTSNIAPDDLYKDGLQRDRFIPFIEILKEKLDIFPFADGADYRLNRLRDVKTYHWPHNADAHFEMQKIFDAVADGIPPEKVEITVKGRFIAVPKAARETAWFTFADLCDTASSAVDYLALADIFRLFIVEDVPFLDDMRHNAVLRFITLIDALYDRRARLVISAAGPPEKLYHGEMHAHAFQRTVSRLMEMQSEGYGTT